MRKLTVRQLCYCCKSKSSLLFTKALLHVAESVFSKLSTVADIENGLCDLRVPSIVLLVAEVQHCIDGSCVLRLKVFFGFEPNITAFFR